MGLFILFPFSFGAPLRCWCFLTFQIWLPSWPNTSWPTQKWKNLLVIFSFHTTNKRWHELKPHSPLFLHSTYTTYDLKSDLVYEIIKMYYTIFNFIRLRIWNLSYLGSGKWFVCVINLFPASYWSRLPFFRCF